MGTQVTGPAFWIRPGEHIDRNKGSLPGKGLLWPKWRAREKVVLSRPFVVRVVTDYPKQGRGKTTRRLRANSDIRLGQERNPSKTSV
jgi:hypothetical protein